jgi:hypothetical protein
MLFLVFYHTPYVTLSLCLYYIIMIELEGVGFDLSGED